MPVQQACATAYRDHLDVWLDLSHQTSEFTDIGQQPQWYRQATRGSTGLSGADTEQWALRMFDAASIECRGCWIAGGSYVEVQLRLEDLVNAESGLRSWRNASVLQRALAKGLAKDFHLSSLPKVLQNNVCVPAGCSRQDIADSVLPLFYEAVLFRHWSATTAVARSRNLLLNVSRFVSIHEMGHWQDLHLDFAILGVDHCGTTSLHRHLSEHPSIVFSEEGEDWFFWNKARRLLPHRSWISEFESRMAAAAAAKRTLTGSSPRIRGIVNPRFFFNALLRKALSLIPQLKVLVVVCDPLGRLERRYADFSACATRGSVGPGHPPCSEQVQDLLEHRHGQLDWLWRSSALEQPLTSTFQHFSHRTLLLHRDWMRDAPGLFFHGAANFLGASWEKLPSFRRFNAWGGHRTDLCRNRTLTRALRLALEPEYAALERFLELSGALPSALRLRIKAILNAAQKNLYEMTATGKGEDDLLQLEKKFEVKIIGADDIEDCNISVHFQEIADFIEAGRKKGGVVIHCAAGVSRASTSCMAYMMIKEHWSLQAAHRRVHAV
ncbi:mpl1, partial [Symbiodinium sp. CCMP2456]